VLHRHGPQLRFLDSHLRLLRAERRPVLAQKGWQEKLSNAPSFSTAVGTARGGIRRSKISLRHLVQNVDGQFLLSQEPFLSRIPLTAIVAGRMHLNRAGTLGFSIAGHDGKAPAGGILHVIDLASNTVVGTAPVGFMGNPIAFEPSGRRAYIPSGAIEGTVTLVQMPQ
jgi:hypothetical protein